MDLALDKLNDCQREAVLATEGPVMVMAGAGSGKTRVLTHRIAYLISELGIPSYNILAVTFTNKAAREMKERISSLLECDTKNMWVSTFHSICSRLLRTESSHLPGYSSNFQIIDEDDGIKIIKEILSDYNSDKYKPKAMKKFISNLKNDITLKYEDPIIMKVFDAYNNHLLKEDLMDFDDLILVTIKLFKENPSVLFKYQNKFQYIMVDEFQDTNYSQYELISLLAHAKNNIFIVGDQDQSIYSFRGAKVENIDRFQKDFVGTRVILLEQNYRSTKNILEAANRVIANNPNRIKKNLFTDNNDSSKPFYYRADTSYEETMFVVDKIKELMVSGYKYRDFAIIYRNNSLSRGFEDIFIKYNMPYVIYGGMSFFSRKEVKDILAYLRLIINHNDDFSLKRIVNEPKRKIGPALITNLTEIATENKTSLFEAIDTLSASKAGNLNLILFKQMINALLDDINDETHRLSKIVDIVLEKTGYYDMLKKDGDEGKDRLDNIKELKTVIEEADEFYEGTRVDKLNSLLNDLALRTDTDAKDDNDDVIKLMTFHQAKGLEFKVVFLVAFESGIFPSINCLRKEELEEERRICYVGITRAKERLYITSCNSRYLFGMQQNQLPSPYIREIGNDYLTLLGNVRKNEFINQPRNTYRKPSVATTEAPKDISFNIGDKINHKAFGDGMVVEVSNDIITVAFKQEYGIKKLIKTHPSIRKI